MNGIRSWVLFVGSLVFVLDWIVKDLTIHWIPPIASGLYVYPYSGIPVFENILGVQFSINHAVNYGAAWGMFSHYQFFLVALRIALVSALVLYFFFWNQKKQYQLPIVLITIGAIGNILDTFLYGYVIDTFHFVFWGYDYPVFNIADCAITGGIILFFLASWREEKRAKQLES